MSEPKAVATHAEKVAEGVWQWTVADERIGGAPSNGTAVEEAPGSIVLVNPVRLREEELDRLGEVAAILLTGAGHLRSAPHYRDHTGAAIWAPVQVELADGVDPDETFTDGNELPGALKAIALPGPRGAEHAFFLKRSGGVMIIGDALTNVAASGGLCVLPKEHNPDVDKTRQSCRKLLDYEYDTAVFGHGEPILGGARDRIAQLLGA
ncbi:MAG: hypothetical protein ABR599_01035 [Gemmatimonadota bacterium]